VRRRRFQQPSSCPPAGGPSASPARSPASRASGVDRSPPVRAPESCSPLRILPLPRSPKRSSHGQLYAESASSCSNSPDHAWMKAPRTLAASNFRLRSASARSQAALDHRWRSFNGVRLKPKRQRRERVVSPRPMSRVIGDRGKTFRSRPGWRRQRRTPKAIGKPALMNVGSPVMATQPTPEGTTTGGGTVFPRGEREQDTTRSRRCSPDASSQFSVRCSICRSFRPSATTTKRIAPSEMKSPRRR
jgi:hypothetical protein